MQSRTPMMQDTSETSTLVARLQFAPGSKRFFINKLLKPAIQ